MASAASKVTSIQAKSKPGSKSSTARHQAKTLRKAHRNGMAWEDYEVDRMVRGIVNDETTLEIALSLGRTYYGSMGMRHAIGTALRHWHTIELAVKNAR